MVNTNLCKRYIGICSALILLTLMLLAYLLQVANIVAYSGAITAGELLAFVEANGYEATDVWDYCMRCIWPYWLVLCSIYAGLLYSIWLLYAHGTRIHRTIFIVIVTFLFVPLCFPLQHNIFHEAMCVIHEIRMIRSHSEDNSEFVFGAIRADTLNEIYVLALGESIRYKNLSLNGTYERQTTPLLEQQSNLCLYSDYYANATLTQHALPMLLTDVTCGDFEQHFARKTIAAAFHETGFRTALISHRAQLMNNGYHDYLAKDFDTVVFVAHDSLIVLEISKIAKNNAKLFIVTHYLGNHMFYTNRTEDCLVWRPDYNADPKAKSDSLFLNAYDNSLLYTDRLLNKEIETLKQMQKLAAWLFVSDHGEYISPKVSGHGHTYHPTIDEYHVPLMVWYSDEYKKAHPNKVTNVIKHKDEPVCADHIFWSVLDMAGIRIDSTFQQVGMSIFGDTLLPHQRTLLLPDGESVMMLD